MTIAKLTRITTQKKNKNRYNIFLDSGKGEEYGFSVDEDVLVQFRLQKNMELDEPTLKSLIQADNLHKSYTQAIHYLSYRMRSEKEIHDYLEGKEVDPEHIKEIMNRLRNENLLNDQEFANSLVRTRISTSSKGPLLIKKELREKGVSEPEANEALLHYSFDKQYEKAFKLAEKKLHQTNRKSLRQQIQDIQQTLMQKGFTNDVIQEVKGNLDTEKEQDSEWEAVVFQGEKLVRKHEKKAEGYELYQKVKASLYRKGFEFDLIERFLDEYVKE